MKYDPIVDKYGRTIGSVRFSLTDRCNLRCEYCMPEEGITWVPKKEILTFEEILRLISLFYNCGIRKFRLSGGEPTLRHDIVNLIQLVKTEYPNIDLAMTTNAILLGNLADQLKLAGLDRLNISIDTLDKEKFKRITKRDQFDAVMKGIKFAIDCGFEDIKINAVSIKEFNDDHASLDKFIEFSKENNIEVRFIELMPFTGNDWKDKEFISSKDLRDKILKFRNLQQLPQLPNSTSTRWKTQDGGSLGFISSVTESFCDSCNRIRITAEGSLRPCLHNASEYDLKGLLRSDASDERILEQIRLGVMQKWKAHPNFLDLKYLPPFDDREMIKIGG